MLTHQPPSFDCRARCGRPHPCKLLLLLPLFDEACEGLNAIIQTG